VLPSPPSSADSFRRTLLPLLAAAAVVAGIAAEWTYYGWGDPRDWLPDLVTGWILIACGLIGWSRRPESRTGALLGLTGFAWFVPDFTVTGVGAIDWLTEHALYLHRGPLIQAVLVYPHGRAGGRTERAALVVAYAAAVVLPIWRSDTATILLAVLFIGVATRGYRRAVGRARRERLYALESTMFLVAVLVAIAAARLTAPTQNALTTETATLLVYEAALCVLAVGLFVALLRRPWERTGVTDLVVELGETRTGTLRDALARALGDPTLEVGYRLQDEGMYVDATGHPFNLPRPGSDRRITRLERDGREIAALVHDRAVLDDPALVEAVAAAARLAASNARLQAAVHAQVAELQASRRRLVAARDEERRRLEQRLDEGAAPRLASLQQVLAQAHDRAGPETLARIQRAETQLVHTTAELQELAAGLHPRELTETGLAPALASLAERSPFPVELELSDERLPPAVEAAAFFICSEALANIAKYASASCAAVRITRRNRLVRVEVVDDGVGGADPVGGSGLRGLSDRVEALGGWVYVVSPPGSGTRISAEIPLD
jgi:signal transduction histidine kinase